MTFWTFLTILISVGVLIAYPRLLLWLIGLAMLGLLFYFGNQSNKKSIHNAVKISIKYDLQNCSKEYPLSVIINNKSNKVIHKIEWSVTAYKPGFSNIIAEHMHREIYKIFNKDDVYRWCYKLPKFTESFPPEQAIYDVDYKHLTLADGENIYQSDAR